MRQSVGWVLAAGLMLAVCIGDVRDEADAAPPKSVLDAEAERVAVIAKVRPAVAAVCFYGGKACGSGVVIDPEGYALTNFHVVQPTGSVMQCGLADGELYDTVLVGQDRVGDVALVKLLPKTPGTPFPFVTLADSDTVRVGDWSLAMGNPFGLSQDFTPTVTYGLVSGVHRYQPPEGKGTLEYTDCIQIDTSINPGNSGGPLFNMAGELIGINGRGSFEKRGRVNSGVGYAISINQIKNFLGHMRAGLDTDHATLGALVETRNEGDALSQMVVGQILTDADAYRRGLRPGDQLVSFAGRPLTSTNQYKNILGVFPKGWRLPVTVRRDNERRELLVRLMGNLDAPVAPKPTAKPGKPAKPDADKSAAKKSPAAKLYEAKPGFANYYFNKLRQDELLEAFHERYGDFSKFDGDWAFDGRIELVDRDGTLKLMFEQNDEGLTEVKLVRNNIGDALVPLKTNQPLGALMAPQGSGGLLAALYQYRRLLTGGRDAFEGGFTHGGHEPFYPPAAGPPAEAGEETADPAARRVACETLRTKHGPFETKWFFAESDHKLLGCEATITSDEDPCELYFSDYRDVGDGRQLPHRIDVHRGDKSYAVLTISGVKLGE